MMEDERIDYKLAAEQLRTGKPLFRGGCFSADVGAYIECSS